VQTFNLPSSSLFPPRLQVCNPDENLHYLSNYLTELSLLDYSMLRFLPSVIAASGIYLANLLLKRTPWDANLRHYSTFVPSDISACVVCLASVHETVTNSPNLAAIKEKYSHARFQSVSRIPPMTVASF
jgi:cyclin A